MAIKERVGSYLKKRVVGSSVAFGWDVIEKGSSGINFHGFDQKRFRDFWNGPATEQEGRDIYRNTVARQFQNDEVANQVAMRLKLISFLSLFLAFVTGISAVYFPGIVFKISALMGFLIFSGFGTMNYHRSQQIKQKCIFGLKEIF